MVSQGVPAPSTRPSLSFHSLSLYVSLLRHLRPSISFTQRSSSIDPPQFLPTRIHLFLQAAMGLDSEMSLRCWNSFKHLVWAADGSESVPPHFTSLLPIFLTYGIPVHVSISELFPPVRNCIAPQCPHNPLYRDPSSPPAPDLAEPITHEVTLFTRAYGAIPGYTTSLYCRGCLTRYHYDCYVSKNVRTYYDGPLRPYIQISVHFLIEGDLCERFATQMVMAWTSSQNCARIYNSEAQALPWWAELPQHWPISFDLHHELVGEAFILYTLLGWHHARASVLRVPHRAPERIRFHAAVQARNLAIAGTGQPEWTHACTRCTQHIKDDNGTIVAVCRSVVVDGVALGHPCCAIHDCKEPLPTKKHRFCALHSGLSDKCAVEGCPAVAIPPFHTCGTPSHRAAEVRHIERGKAMFQLKPRLWRITVGSAPLVVAVPSPQGSVSAESLQDGGEGFGGLDDGDDDGADEVEVDQFGELLEHCEDKPRAVHCNVFARFGRRRTHNEELCAASCGVILGRATFYGAEGPNSVRKFLKGLFPTPSSLPNVIWYDNNCGLAEMLQKDEDHYFDRVALPVDVFHFKSKHGETHGFCGRNCNPAQWHELIDDTTGEWVFNSLGAEQANAWIGGFRAMTRTMHADWYNYFLDEMIMRRNRILVQQLEDAGCAPYAIPRQELLHGWEGE